MSEQVGNLLKEIKLTPKKKKKPRTKECINQMNFCLGELSSTLKMARKKKYSVNLKTEQSKLRN